MKSSDHFIGDRVSVRCRRSYLPGNTDVSWLAGTIIGRDRLRDRSRYVVQLDDSRRVVAFDDDIRRWTLCFDVLEVLEKIAS